MSLAVLLTAVSVFGTAAAPLAAERWNRRIVLVFAEGESGDAARQIDALLADRSALSERDILLIEVVGDRISTLFGEMSAESKAVDLRETFGIAASAPFTVILVGKDGGEKLRREEPVAAKDLFGLIDSMPMRQREAGG